MTGAFPNPAKRIWLRGLAIMLLLITLAAFMPSCSAQEDGMRYVIGISLADMQSPESIAITEEIKSEVAKHPDVTTVFYDAAGTSVKQCQDIEDMLTQRIDLLVITPNSGSDLIAEMNKVYDSGIPIIVLGYPPESAKYTMRIYVDNHEVGRMAGEYVRRLYGNRPSTVLEIQGDPSSPISAERRQGFHEAIAQDPAISVEYVIVGYWQRDKTMENIKSSGVMDKQPKVDIVFAHNDAMAAGAQRVAQEKNINVKIIGIGGLQGKNGGLVAILNGTIDVTFRCPTGGAEAMMYALKILGHEKVPYNLELPIQQITRDNVDQFLKGEE